MGKKWDLVIFFEKKLHFSQDFFAGLGIMRIFAL